MYIEVNLNQVNVKDLTDFGSLCVRPLEEISDRDIDSSLRAANAGEMADRSVAIDISWLRLRVLSESSEEASKFEDMIAFADRQGWVAGGGTHVLAHLDRKP
jgi:hypothetical protein